MVSIRNFVIRSRYYLCLLLFLMILFYFVKNSYEVSVLEIDNFISNFVQNHFVSDKITSVMKVVTNFGDIIVFGVILLLIFLLFRGKGYFSSMSLNLLCTYLFSVIFKNVFMRERPPFSLIDKPNDYSFPSGHTMCSVAFYGFLIYLISKYVKNKVLKCFLIVLSVLIVIVVAFSRVYLNVHYFSDVIGGFVLGVVCLLMFVNYVKIRNII